jgi:hypothetical protein
MAWILGRQADSITANRWQFVSRVAGSASGGASAADLKFLHRLPQSHSGTSNRKRH